MLYLNLSDIFWFKNGFIFNFSSTFAKKHSKKVLKYGTYVVYLQQKINRNSN